MRAQYPFRISIGFATVTLLLSGACSTTVPLPQKPDLPVVPDYVKVPHPAGFDLADLKLIFFSPLAPKAVLGEFADTCDEDYKKLSEMTKIPDERRKAAEELVTTDPERMHWCFYTKISKLQEVLQGDTTWSTRQKKVLETFEFLSPIGKAYMEVYHDSRYLRWATQYYSKISEWVFFRKVVPTAENTVFAVANARNSLEPWVAVSQEKIENSVFAKYGITMAPTIAGSGGVDPTAPPTITQDMAGTDEQKKVDEAARVPASADDGANPDLPPAVTKPENKK